MIRVASIGECMAEMIARPDGLYSWGYAGDTFNMAQYLAWVGAGKGIGVSYVTVLGRDRFGREMLESWIENGIDTSAVMTTDEKNTGLYFADLDSLGNRDYTFFRSDSAAKTLFRQRDSARIFENLLNYDMIYASAISLMILNDEDRQKLVTFFEQAKAKGIRTAFDTNYRKSGWASPAEVARWITAILPHCSIVLPTNDENRDIFGDSSEEDTVRRIAAAGVDEIACKCGGDKAVVFDRGRVSAVPAIQGVQVVDTTSAGDSFNGAYLAARLLGLAPEQAARWGHRMAAEVIQHRGALIPVGRIPIFTMEA